MTIAVARTDAGHVLTGLPGYSQPVYLDAVDLAELYLAIGASKPVTALRLPELCHAMGDRPTLAACGATQPGDGIGLLTSGTWTLVTCPDCLKLAGTAEATAEPEAEAVWSLSRIHEVMNRTSHLHDVASRSENARALTMLRWHADHAEVVANVAAHDHDAELAHLVDEWGTLGTLHKLLDRLYMGELREVLTAYLTQLHRHVLRQVRDAILDVVPLPQPEDEPVSRDAAYLLLLGAREALCTAQTNLPVHSWRAQLGEAIRRIDGVAARACPDQWSEHDRTDRLPSPLGPQEAPIATGDDPATSAMIVALVAVIRSAQAIGLADAITQARRAVGMAGPGLYEDAADYEAVIRQALGR